jgi:transposase
MRRMLDGLFHLVRTGCRQWRHLPPPPAFPPWRTVYGATCAPSRTRTCGGRSATIW